MAVHVRFKINAKTGEVTVFEVNQDQDAPGVQHERTHDAAAAAIARAVGARPAITTDESRGVARIPRREVGESDGVTEKQDEVQRPLRDAP